MLELSILTRGRGLQEVSREERVHRGTMIQETHIALQGGSKKKGLGGSLQAYGAGKKGPSEGILHQLGQ